jgi:hypothetical protein
MSPLPVRATPEVPPGPLRVIALPPPLVSVLRVVVPVARLVTREVDAH